MSIGQVLTFPGLRVKQPNKKNTFGTRFHVKGIVRRYLDETWGKKMKKKRNISIASWLPTRERKGSKEKEGPLKGEDKQKPSQELEEQLKELKNAPSDTFIGRCAIGGNYFVGMVAHVRKGLAHYTKYCIVCHKVCIFWTSCTLLTFS